MEYIKDLKGECSGEFKEQSRHVSVKRRVLRAEVREVAGGQMI